MRRLQGAATVAIISVLLLSGSAQARQESWYSCWGVGWASNSYPDELPDPVNDFKNDPEANTTYSTCLDAFGTYWPLKNKKPLSGPS